MRIQTIRLTMLTSAIAILSLATAMTANAQGWQPPAESVRCPSKWGAGDERGSANHMKPDAVLRAAQWNAL